MQIYTDAESAYESVIEYMCSFRADLRAGIIDKLVALQNMGVLTDDATIEGYENIIASLYRDRPELRAEIAKQLMSKINNLGD